MNETILAQLRRLADGRCDYCRIPSLFDPLPFQVDHIIAQQHGGETVLENLAWSCLAVQFSWAEPGSRATIRVLAINDPDAVAFRAELMEEGVFFRSVV